MMIATRSEMRMLYAAKNNDLTALHAYSKNSNFDAQDSDGKTALMIAAECGNEQIIDYLLDGGARIDMQDKAGKTATEYASTSDIKARLELAEYLSIQSQGHGLKK